jgi:hypothetical protein
MGEIAESGGGDERWVSSVAGLQLSGSPYFRGKESPVLLLLAWDDSSISRPSRVKHLSRPEQWPRPQPPTNREADSKSTRRCFPSAPSWLTSPVGKEVEEDSMSVGRGTRVAQLSVVMSKSTAWARQVLGQDDARWGCGWGGRRLKVVGS